MNDKLKPCPFCGGEAGIIARTSMNPINYITGYSVFVGCVECSGSVAAWADNRQTARTEAIAAWNRRTE